MAHFSRLHACVLLLGMLAFSPACFSGTTQTELGRYVTISNQPLPEQTQLLTQTFRIHFPADVRTIGQAIRYLLWFSGYSLVNQKKQTQTVTSLLKQPLPLVDRTLGPLTLQEGLLTLVGEPFGLVVDPVHRLIGFRLKPAYQSIYQ